jgi:hypothetical protein
MWEIHLIVMGYRKRDRLKHQLMAECAYAATYAMRDPKGKTPADIFPSLFDDEDDFESAPPLTDEEIKEEQARMAAMNAAIFKGETQP